MVSRPILADFAKGIQFYQNPAQYKIISSVIILSNIHLVEFLVDVDLNNLIHLYLLFCQSLSQTGRPCIPGQKSWLPNVINVITTRSIIILILDNQELRRHHDHQLYQHHYDPLEQFHQLKELKEALVVSDVVGGLQQRARLLLSVGRGAPDDDDDDDGDNDDYGVGGGAPRGDYR